MKMVRGAWAASTLWLVATSCAVSREQEPKALHTTRRGIDLDAGQQSTERDAVSRRDSGGDADAKKATAQDAGAVMKDASASQKKRQVAQGTSQGRTTTVPEMSNDEASSDVDEDAGVPAQTEHSQASERPATLVDLGEQLFQDRSLSATGTQSCASCHAPEQAFTGSADHDRPRFAVSRGAQGNIFGTRNAPTAMYAQYSPPLAFLPDEEPGAFTPTGGLFWDGRVNTLSEQAAAPFLNPREMALPDAQALIAHVRQASYAWMFEPLFGPDPFNDVQEAYRHVTDAIAAFERTPKFRPFTSKFDAYLRGQTVLSDQEQHGFELFKDPQKGNCLACHVGNLESRDPQAWLFTDFTYDNLGVPRNLQIADNADANYFDLGLCQSPVVAQKIPSAIADKNAFVASLCGAFKVPTLRNIASTAPYMHNGYFENLRDVVDFYVTRETEPARWYPSGADGSVQKYNDLPAQYAANVNTTEVPYDRKLGEAPRLSPEEIDAVVAFLITLTDGYSMEPQDSDRVR